MMQSKALNIPKSLKHNWKRLDQLKCEHFLNFIFTIGFLMDLAYGTTTSSLIMVNHKLFLVYFQVFDMQVISKIRFA